MELLTAVVIVFPLKNRVFPSLLTVSAPVPVAAMEEVRRTSCDWIVSVVMELVFNVEAARLFPVPVTNVKELVLIVEAARLFPVPVTNVKEDVSDTTLLTVVALSSLPYKTLIPLMLLLFI